MAAKPGESSQARDWVYDPDLHGSADWASPAHLLERGYGPSGAHLLGYLPPEQGRAGCWPVTYDGQRHELIVAPTRAGKGVSDAVPRLLDHPGGVIVLDIKDGELARITAGYRNRILGQPVDLIDPFDATASDLGLAPARVNPLAGIDLEGDEAFDEAYQIASACVIPERGGENHWDGEAASLIAGLCLFEASQGGTLGDMRDALNRNKEGFKVHLAEMAASPYRLISDAAARLDNKAERELSGVLSTAHRNTHFLESAALRSSLSGQDLDFAAIGDGRSVYICLPARRIRSAKRWLRLLIATLINALAARAQRPDLPVLVVLEEMAALERMDIIEQSAGLMAGLGIQLLIVVQDFTQLKDLYRDRWETFIANAASVQCFGTNDFFTARYLSQMSGQTSIERLSYESAKARASIFGDPAYRSPSDQLQGRPLIAPDELMSLHPSVQFIKLAAARPVIGYRPVYYLDKRYRDRRGRPLYDVHPDHAHKPVLKALDFTSPRVDVGAVLGQHLGVG